MDTANLPRNLIIGQSRRRKYVNHPVSYTPAPRVTNFTVRGIPTLNPTTKTSLIYTNNHRKQEDSRHYYGNKQVALILESSNVHSRQRKVVTTRDFCIEKVIYALNRLGNTLYGF
ncbi:hypothetical protein BDV35DRAFT_399832 [Aspergillus flavus]|uniref:Uncharacterized protein n=1 Tax=Aspergillus flavus TaxID=5059 RepID=A0A5N6GQC1_ASPFL|nr:hypothetical protein BDV35DRAFT_399832 [Aspergillus flavus]